MAKKEIIVQFEKFLEEYAPYRATNFLIGDLSDITQTKELIIEQHCARCGKIRSFKTLSMSQFGAVQKTIMDMYKISALTNKSIYEMVDMKKKHYIIIEFTCQHGCGERYAIPLLIQGETVMKIGQYPTFSKLEVEEGLKKYKNVISKYYPELTKSVSCYSQNMGIPAFVYLRRILEHLVDEKYKNLENVIENEKFIEKLKKVEEAEEIIPIELESIKSQIYIVLSKGVHEYEEKECLLLYDSVKFVIESILDKEVQKKERAQKAAAAQQAIQAKLKEQKKDD